MEMKPLPSLTAELPHTAGPGRLRMAGASSAQRETCVRSCTWQGHPPGC